MGGLVSWLMGYLVEWQDGRRIGCGLVGWQTGWLVVTWKVGGFVVWHGIK